MQERCSMLTLWSISSSRGSSCHDNACGRDSSAFFPTKKLICSVTVSISCHPPSDCIFPCKRAPKSTGFHSTLPWHKVGCGRQPKGTSCPRSLYLVCDLWRNFAQPLAIQIIGLENAIPSTSARGLSQGLVPGVGFRGKFAMPASSNPLWG